MDLVREILDHQILDRNEEKVGKVDGIVLELRDDGPPRVAFLETGLVTLLDRLGPALGRIGRGLDTAFHLEPTTLRIPVSKILEVGIDIKVDVDVHETVADQWERLARRVLRRIPGSGL